MAKRDISENRPRRWTGVAKSAAIHAAVGFALYLVFAGQASENELLTGVVLAVAIAGWALALRACCGAQLAVGTDHVRPWLRTIAGLPGATVGTGGALLAAIVGRASPRTEESAFIHGSADEPRANARRATAVLIASLAPDSFVVRTPAGEDHVLIHRLARARRAPDALWLA